MTAGHEGKGRNLILMGGGGHAAVVADAARLAGWNVLGFVSDAPPDDGQRRAQLHAGLQWLGATASLADLLRSAPSSTHIFPAVGDGALRRAWMTDATLSRVAFAVVVHPAAVVAESATLEPGVFVGAQAVVGPRAAVHDGAIINTSAVIEHDCIVGAWSHVAPGCVLTGGVTIGRAVMVGTRTVIIPERIVGDGAMIAAGAVVTQHIEPGLRVAGCPARPMSMPAHAPQAP